MASYQEFMINNVRAKENWDARFVSIKYSDALKIAKDKNIKEISIYYDYGISKEKFNEEKNSFTRIHLCGYDEKAIKNAGITVIEGRMPQKSNEISISNNCSLHMNKKLGEELEFTCEEETKKYTIVGLIEQLEEEQAPTPYEHRYQAITYLEKEQLLEDTVIDIEILTKDITQTYKTAERLSKQLNLQETPNINKTLEEDSITYDTKEIKDIFDVNAYLTSIGEENNDLTQNQEGNNKKVVYNAELLKYAGVCEIDAKFSNLLLIIRSDPYDNHINCRNYSNLYIIQDNL